MTIILIGFITVGLIILFIGIPTLFHWVCDCKNNNNYREL